MIATLLSLIISGALLFYPPMATAPVNLTLLTITMLTGGALALLLFSLTHLLSWAPLQKVEQNLTPRLLDLYSADGHLKLFNIWFSFFPLASFVLAAAAIPFKFSANNILLAVWILLLGITIDAFGHLYRRIVSYLNPFSIVGHLREKGRESIQDEDHAALCHWIEALGEIGTKAIDKFLPTLCNEVIDSMYRLAKEYLSSAKSISHHLEEAKKDHLDQVSYTLFYLFQQMEQIHEKALSNKLEAVSSKMITSLGKITIAAGQYDLTMTDYPLYYLGKFAAAAQKNRCGDIAERATCTLVEVGKALVEEVDIRYQELIIPFSSLLSHLEAISNERFKENKKINISLLMQPFSDLKQLFNEGSKAAEHQDRAAILIRIDDILSRFQQLELVMRTIPPLPDFQEAKPEAARTAGSDL